MTAIKRGRVEIMAQILALCTEPRKKTRIMYLTNLSHEMLKTYLAFLTSRSMLGYQSDTYVTSEKGRLFIDAFNQLDNVLKDRYPPTKQ